MALSVSAASLCKTSKIATLRTPVKTLLNLIVSKQQLKISPIFRRQSMSLFSIKPILKLNPGPQFATSSVQSLFTGIVEEMAEVKHLGTTADGGFNLNIRAKTVLEGVNLGDNIAAERNASNSHFTFSFTVAAYVAGVDWLSKS